ncbi:MAG: N-acetylmuramoyl-L-alanine amidase [Deinococcota bacterium]
MIKSTRYFLIILSVLAAISLQGVFAQACLNYISVNNARPETPTACYFLQYDDNSNAFARADVLASALNLSQRYDAEQAQVLLTRGSSQLALASTADIRYGLTKRAGVLHASTALQTGASFDSPMAIQVGGDHYLPVAPVVRALGGDATWHSGSRTIVISITQTETSDTETSDTETALTVNTTASPNAAANASTEETAVVIGTPVSRLGQPRVGIHETYTRIAIDLPNDTEYSLALITDTTLAVTFTGTELALEAAGGNQTGGNQVSSNHVTAWQYQALDDTLALVIQTEHDLSPQGQGFQVGFLPRSSSRASDVLYLDFSSERQGPTVRQVPASALSRLDSVAASAQNASSSVAANGSTTPTSSTPDNATLLPNAAVTRTVVIDPGHGGYDPGAQGYVSEEVVVLDIALKVRDLLESQDISVILSRDDDYHLDARKATDLAARAAMASPDRNLFVSIHANAAESSRAHGIETWIFGEPLEEDLIQNAIIENGGGSIGLQLTEEAKQVHDSVINDIFRQEQLYYSQTLAEAIQASMIDATGATDRGIRKNYFYVIRNASIPAVLVEVGFVSNPEEGRKLARDDYRDRLARGIADGIVAFFEQDGALVDSSN